MFPINVYIQSDNIFHGAGSIIIAREPTRRVKKTRVRLY